MTSKSNWVVIAYRFQHLNVESGQREKEEQLELSVKNCSSEKGI